MFEEAVYVRTEEGYVERMDNVISNLRYAARNLWFFSPPCA